MRLEEHRPTLLLGDCRETLKILADGSVHCAVTSPPYWGMRDYGVSGQIGLEESPEEWVEGLTGVFRAVRRVLRGDGTLWLNCGDAYDAGTRTTRDYSKTTKHGYWSNPAIDKRVTAGLKPKDLIGLPWLLAFALRASGWYLRSAITWCKPSPMPESCRDRPTSATEMLFLLARSDRYYYDADAIAEPCVSEHGSGNGFKRPARLSYLDDSGSRGNEEPWVPDGQKRNRRNWWVINSQPTPEAHFATFPEALVEPCILAGTSDWGCCPECGAPWRRVVEKERRPNWDDGRQQKHDGTYYRKNPGGGVGNDRRARAEAGWEPSCQCGHEHTDPCVVLDPFAGSGTTGKVATRLGRRSILCEMNEAYVDIALRRNAQLGLML